MTVRIIPATNPESTTSIDRSIEQSIDAPGEVDHTQCYASHCPNIIMVLSDDHGYTDLGKEIDPNVDTPNLDRMVREGVRFTSGYSSAPQCVPSRAGLMSGRDQNRYGLFQNGADAGHGEDTLPPNVKTIAEHVRKRGYVTGMAGKWHLGSNHDNKTNPTGDLPEFGRKGQMIEEFAKAAFELEIGEVSGVVETAFGFHIIQRLKPEVKITCKHLLVMHTGSMRVPPNIKRSKDEAKARCEEALAKIKGGAKFGDVVREYHDNKSNLTGDLPPFGRKGQMVEEFSKAAFELKPGEISGVVESPFGFHIIKRLK